MKGRRRSRRVGALVWTYLGLGLAVAVAAGGTAGAELAWGPGAGWVTVPVLLAGAGGLLRKVLTDSQDQRPAVRWGLWLVGSGLEAGLGAGLSFAVTEGVRPFNGVLVSVAVVYCAGWTLAGLLGAARWLLGRRSGLLSVARHTLDEALGLRVVNGFVVLFLLLIPVLLFGQSPEQPVRYRVQQFLGYGLGLSGVMLSLFVILFGSWTLSSEMRQRQVQVSLVKPVGRGAFVLGKWLGVVVVSGSMLAVAGLTVYLFTVFYLAKLEPTDALDATAVKQEVLTARVSVKPRPPEDLAERVRRKMEQLLASEAGRSMIIDRGGTAVVENELMQQELSKWRSLGPRERSAQWKQDYYFEGLERAAAIGGAVTLRYKIKVRGDWGVKTPLRIILNDGQGVWDFDSALDIVQNVPISTRYIDPSGRLKVTIENLSSELSVIFPDEHLELLYTVDRFGPNFLRAVAVMGVKLVFLSALAVLLSTFLGFAVAGLGGMLLYVVTSMSPFILEASRSFVLDEQRYGQAVQWTAAVIRAVNQAVAQVFGVFAQYRPVTLLTEGRYVGWMELGGCVVKVGLMWTLPLLLLAWWIFQRRELARVQV